MPAITKTMKAKTDKRRRKRVYFTRADGTEIIRWAQGKNDAELEKDVIRIRSVLEQEEQDSRMKKMQRPDITFREYATDWYERDRKPNLAPSSRMEYLSVFNKHLFPTFGDMKICDITRNHIKDFLNTYEGKAAKNTVTKLRMILKEVLTEAADNDLIDIKLILNWKKIKLPDLKEAIERRALTQAENSAAHWVGYNNPEGFYLLMLYHLGLRRGEALALKWGDFDLVNRIVYIQRDLDLHVMKHDGHLDKGKAKAAQQNADKVDRIGKLKTRAGKRVVPIFDPEFHDYLLKKQGGDDEFIFVGKKSGEPLSEASFKRMWVRLMKAMVERAPDIDGIYGMKKVDVVEGGKTIKKLEKVKIMSILTPHYFRHNFATALYWANVRELQACAWMGHADVTMINKIYGHLRITDSGNEVQKMADYIKQRISCANDVPKQLPKIVNQ